MIFTFAGEMLADAMNLGDDRIINFVRFTWQRQRFRGLTRAELGPQLVRRIRNWSGMRILFQPGFHLFEESLGVSFRPSARAASFSLTASSF